MKRVNKITVSRISIVSLVVFIFYRMYVNLVANKDDPDKDEDKDHKVEKQWRRVIHTIVDPFLRPSKWGK